MLPHVSDLAISALEVPQGTRGFDGKHHVMVCNVNFNYPPTIFWLTYFDAQLLPLKFSCTNFADLLFKQFNLGRASFDNKGCLSSRNKSLQCKSFLVGSLEAFG